MGRTSNRDQGGTSDAMGRTSLTLLPRDQVGTLMNIYLNDARPSLGVRHGKKYTCCAEWRGMMLFLYACRCIVEVKSKRFDVTNVSKR